MTEMKAATMRGTVFLLWFVALCCLAALAGCMSENPVSAPDGLPRVRINEFLARSTTGEPDWLELYNAGDDTVELAGYYLVDDLTKPTDEWFEIPARTTVGPGGFLLFRKRKGQLFRLKSGGEEIFLVAPDRRRIVDQHLFYEQFPDVSEGRYPDGGENWVRFGSPTPGGSNVSGGISPCGNIVINELLAINDEVISNPLSGFADWFELFNLSDLEMELGGLYLTDDRDRLTKWRIPDGSKIAGRGYLLLWADGLDTLLHTNFKLDGDGESLLLVNRDGRTVCDDIDFGPQTPDRSYGRFPDGASNWVVMEPSPEAANRTGP